MQNYSLTSDRFSGEILFTYNENDELYCLEIRAQLTQEQWAWLYEHLPIKFIQLQEMIKVKGSTMKVTQIEPDLSFERFYKLYNYKVGKKEAENAWNRLSKANKVKAIAAIRKYEQWLSKSSIAKLYPATYLNQERFNDELK